MIRLVKTCAACGAKSIIEIDLEKQIVRLASIWGGGDSTDWIEYPIARSYHADRLIYAATINGYLVE